MLPIGIVPHGVPALHGFSHRHEQGVDDVIDELHRAGLRSGHLHAASMASVSLCLTLWVRAKTVDQAERGNAERRALFVGLWPPTLWLIGESLHDRE